MIKPSRARRGRSASGRGAALFGLSAGGGGIYSTGDPGIALLITNPNAVYNLDRTGQTGAVKMQGFTTWAGYIDLAGNSYTSLDCSAITACNGQIAFRGNAIQTANFSNLVSNAAACVIDLLGNPLSSVDFSALTTVNATIYLAGAFGVGNAELTAASFPALTTLNAALVMSRRYNLATFSVPNLVSLSHEIELDYCKSLTTVSFPSLATITGTVAGPSIAIGGDMTDIGQTRPPAVSSVLWPVLANVNDAVINITWCSNLTTIDLSPWTTLANGFRLDMNRCALTTAAINAALIKLDAIKGSVTNGYIDFRFQTGGGAPSGAPALAAKANLVTAWGAGNVLTD